jgi:hypothetical protein
MGKFFTVEVKPTIAASKQALGAYTDFDLLFDWTAFDVPKGASKLVNAIAVSRGPDGVAHSHGLNLYFAKTLNSGATAPGGLGTIHATANGTGYQNHLIGACTLEEVDIATGLDIVTVHAIAGHGGRMAGPSIVLEGEPDSGTNVGYDKLYLGGVAVDGDYSTASTVQVSTETATSTTAVVVKTTSALIAFDKGDIIHDEDDQLIGTIKTVTDATNIVLEDNCANVSAVNKDLYCINPIKIILHFER